METESIAEIHVVTQDAKRVDVVLYNDNSTPFDFVVDVISRYCMKSEADARVIAKTAEECDWCFVGDYAEMVADGMVRNCMRRAKTFGHNDFKMEVRKDV